MKQSAHDHVKEILQNSHYIIMDQVIASHSRLVFNYMLN